MFFRNGGHYFFNQQHCKLEVTLLIYILKCKEIVRPVLLKNVTKGFWNALDDLDVKEAWIVSAAKDSYPIPDGVKVSGLNHFISFMKKH